MKILSIDWDYFIGATALERAALMPDGGNENIPQAFQNAIWVSHYIPDANPVIKGCRRSLKDIPIRRQELIDLRTLLAATVTKKTRVYIAESHADIFNPLKAITREFTEEFELINIDHHHDCWRYGEDSCPVDCGNWLAKVIEQSHDNAHVSWVSNPDSEGWELGDLNPKTMRQIGHYQKFDMVFLCRSGMWSLPHLDKYFLILAQYLNKQCKGNAIYTTPFAKENRWTKVFQANVKHTEKAIKDRAAKLTGIIKAPGGEQDG